MKSSFKNKESTFENPSIMIFSAENNLRSSKEQNSALFRDFSNNEPDQALRDFHRNQSFLDKRFITQGKTNDIIDRNIDGFIHTKTKKKQSTATESTQALSEFLKARGGQALSFDLTKTLSEKFELSPQHNNKKTAVPDPFVAGSAFEVSFYSHTTKNNELKRFDIQLSFSTSIGGEFKLLSSKTGKLETPTPEELNKIQNIIRNIEYDLLSDEKYAKLQARIARETDLLVITKILELVIEKEIGYRPIVFGCSTRTLTGVSPKTTSPSDLPKKLFDCTSTNYVQFPSKVKPGTKTRVPTRGVFLEQNDCVIGSNTDEVIINAKCFEENNRHITAEKRHEHYGRVINLNNAIRSLTSSRQTHFEKNGLAENDHQTLNPQLNHLFEFVNYLRSLIRNVVDKLWSVGPRMQILK